MIRICNKYIVLLGILMSLFIGSLALAADPLKIDLQNATCKCSGITAKWTDPTDPQTKKLASWAGDVNFVGSFLYLQNQDGVSADCKNTVRVQVADIKGNPLDTNVTNVTVSVDSKGSTKTDDDGIARFEDVSKGMADINVTADRYQPQTLTVPVGCGLIHVAVRLMPN